MASNENLKIVDVIGVPAALEQLAEECCELAQAALKTARVLRGENITPVSKDSARSQLIEEYTDVLLCSDILVECGLIHKSDELYDYKTRRWQFRLDIQND